METNPLAPTPFELAWAVYGVTVFAALLTLTWAVVTRRITLPEMALAVLLAVAVPFAGSVTVLGWLLTTKIQASGQ